MSNARGQKPLFVGLNGAQGSGKTTLVSAIAEKLRQAPHSLPTIVLSIDDLYLTHEHQFNLASAHPANPMVQHRGQPSTHDLPLALSLFADLHGGKEVRVPSYDKSAFNGQGDRAPHDTWQVVNRAREPATKVVIFEGWCVGFRALSEETLRSKWQDAVTQIARGDYSGRLGHNRFDDIRFINEASKQYDELTDQLDAIIHLDAADPLWVYRWREQQEWNLRKAKGSGMTDDQVKSFVDGYYPSYELYTDGLRRGVFEGRKGKQLRLVIKEDRRIQEVLTI